MIVCAINIQFKYINSTKTLDFILIVLSIKGNQIYVKMSKQIHTFIIIASWQNKITSRNIICFFQRRMLQIYLYQLDFKSLNAFLYYIILTNLQKHKKFKSVFSFNVPDAKSLHVIRIPQISRTIFPKSFILLNLFRLKFLGNQALKSNLESAHPSSFKSNKRSKYSLEKYHNCRNLIKD